MEIILKELLNFLSIELTVLLTAAMPIIELRGAIPVGMSLGMSPAHATVISFIGSMIPVPFILFTIRPMEHGGQVPCTTINTEIFEILEHIKPGKG